MASQLILSPVAGLCRFKPQFKRMNKREFWDLEIIIIKKKLNDLNYCSTAQKITLMSMKTRSHKEYQFYYTTVPSSGP